MSAFFVLKTQNPKRTMRKSCTQTSVKGPCAKCSTRASQNPQGHQKQGKSKKFLQTRGNKGGRMTKHKVASGWDPDNRKKW